MKSNEKELLEGNVDKLKNLDTSNLSLEDDFGNLRIFHNPDEALVIAGRLQKQNEDILYCELNSGYSLEHGEFITINPVYRKNKKQRLKEFPELTLKAVWVQMLEEAKLLEEKLEELNGDDKND